MDGADPPQEAEPTLNAGHAPPLLYDYYNFPPEAYRIEYPAPGSPGLAERAFALLRLACCWLGLT